MQPYAQTILSRSLTILQTTLTQELTQQDVNLDFAVCSLDTIGALSEGFTNNFPALLQSLGPESCTALRECVFRCCQSSNDDVKQSGFSLSGELSQTSFELLAPVSAQLLELAFNNLNVDDVENDSKMGICNNACWTAGLLALQMGPELILPYAASLAATFSFLMAQCDGAYEPICMCANVCACGERLCV